ncbi:MAG: hypothetical protein VW270_12605 [Candidatus Poseidoniales archaeon]
MYNPEKDPAFVDNPYLMEYPSIGDDIDIVIEDIGYDHQCSNPNPPPWCPNANVPLEVGPIGLVLSMMFGVILLKGKLGI